jgi:hypothetical protein
MYYQQNQNIFYAPQPFTPGNVNLNISYKNYENDSRYKSQLKQDYGKELLSQIEEKRRQKEYEKQKKHLEDIQDEMRIKAYHDQLEQRQKMYNKDPNKPSNILNNIDSTIKYNYRLHTSLVEPKTVRPNPIQKVTLDPLQILLNKKEDEKLYNKKLLLDMERIRNEMLNRQNDLLNRVNRIKLEQADSSFQKIGLNKELSSLKEEIRLKQSHDKVMKDYLYYSIVDTNKKRGEMNKVINDLYINKSCHINYVNNRYGGYVETDPREFLKDYDYDKIKLSKQLTENEIVLKNLERVENEYSNLIGYFK